MSSKDSGSSSDVSLYNDFRGLTRQRLSHEMLRFAREEDKESTWKVLITENFTLRIMSSVFKMDDIRSVI
ncbi:hypothetical protein RCOM_1030820 [Ricinus communis]|uniref:Uncharacterized protein n=1 Tax=Ricinus communis TaxID=3988 RepID=B9RJ41_RICCO|nr:hypothetical protein RCOM_1030820 [Ricinus communis]